MFLHDHFGPKWGILVDLDVTVENVHDVYFSLMVIMTKNGHHDKKSVQDHLLWLKSNTFTT